MAAALRKALFWLVMLALPLQGIAVAGMAPLHVLEHGATQQNKASEKSVLAGGNASDMAPQSTGDCAGMMADCDRAPGLLKCALSAVCGLVAAPALQMPASVQSESARAPIAVRSHARVAFYTDAPERPPRPLV